MPVLEWLSGKEAAQRLQCSPRTLEKWVTDGRIQSRLEQRPGRKKERMFHAGDVERITQSKEDGESFGRPRSLDGAAVIEVVPEWLKSSEACAVLGKTPRSLDRLVERGKLKTKLENGKRFYSAGDLERIRKQSVRAPEPIQRQIAAPSALGENAVVLRQLMTQSTSNIELEQARLAFERERWEAERADRELREKDWLTPRECARLRGLPSTIVKALAEEGKIAGLRHGKSWRIRRASLEAFAG